MAKQLRNFRIQYLRGEVSDSDEGDSEWLFDKLEADREGRERTLEPKQLFSLVGPRDTPVLVNLKKKATPKFVKQALGQALGPSYSHSVEPVETIERGEKFVPGEREADGRCRSTIEREAAAAGGESSATFVLVDATYKTTYSYDGRGVLSRVSRGPRFPRDVDAGATADTPQQGLTRAGSAGSVEQQPTTTSVTLQAAFSLHSLSQRGVHFPGVGGGGVKFAPVPPPPDGGSPSGTADTGNVNSPAMNPFKNIFTSADFMKRKTSAANRGLHIEINSGTSYATDAERVHPPGAAKRGRTPSMLLRDVSLESDDLVRVESIGAVGQEADKEAPLPVTGSSEFPADRDALRALFRSTGGSSWRRHANWDGDALISQWCGVVNEGLRVIELNLKGNNLTGSFPRELGRLGALQHLDVSMNKLSGPIPKELGALSKLEQLLLYDNKLTGPIPPELGMLATLQELDLSGNQLCGHIPPQLGNLSALEKLDLSDNNLDGPISKELGALSELKVVSLQDNRLKGPVPPELGNLHALQLLDVSKNGLSAFWDHTIDVARDEELLQRFAAGDSLPRQLSHLLDFLSKLQRENGLEMGSNPWEEPPEAVVEKGLLAVSEYFDDLFAEGTAIRRNIKVVLVGQVGAGKTSLRQSMRNRRPTPTIKPAESTVLVDVEEMGMAVDGVSLRVYDFPGQVAYTGLLQHFLSPRAVTLLACDTSAFGHGGGGSGDQESLQRDLSRLQEMRVFDWLRSLRLADSDVVLVATKCDLAGGMAANLAGRMERATRKWLGLWSDSQMTAIRVEDRVSLTSCAATTLDGGAALGKRKSPEESMWTCDWREDGRDETQPNLLRRVMYNSNGTLRGAAMVLPKSWSIALEVLEALGSGRDPVESVLKANGTEGGKGVTWRKEAQQHKGIEGLPFEKLSAKWNEVVDSLKNHGVTVTNPLHALEGALSIREHERSLIRHDTYIFLDVTWLAEILKPLLNHRDHEDFFSGSISLGDTGITLDDDEHITSWKRLKDEGVLEPTLARVFWPDGLSEHVLPALDSLGLTHPLDSDFAKGRVVLLRLGGERPKRVGEELDNFRRDHTAVLTVAWKIFMGVPPGAIEKVLTRCCSIGEPRTFWRFGVLVQGRFGEATTGKTFALLIEYSHDTNEIDMKVYGNIGTADPWAALSHGVSAVRRMCLDFPGLRWRAYLQCPQHNERMQISNKATQTGDKLLLGNSCTPCRSETKGLGAAAADLLQMIDVLQSPDEIFREVHKRFVALQDRYPALGLEVAQDLHPKQAHRPLGARFSGMEEHFRGGVKELLGGLVGRAHTSSGVDAVGDTCTEGELKDASRGLQEVSLQELVSDMQRLNFGPHQDMRGLTDIVDGDDVDKLDFVVAMLMAMRRDGFDTPRQACILPPWKFAKVRGLSEDEQAPQVWVKRLAEWGEDDFKQGKGFFKKKKRLFLVCAHTHRLVPCGSNGQGYDIQLPRIWFRMSPNVATFAQQVMRSTQMSVAAMPRAASSASPASAAMEKMVEMLESMTLDDDGADVDVASQVAQLGRDPYAALREFIHGVEDTARLDIVKARKAHRERRGPPSSREFVFFAQEMTQVQTLDGDADVQWVFKGHEDAWYSART